MNAGWGRYLDSFQEVISELRRSATGTDGHERAVTSCRGVAAERRSYVPLPTNRGIHRWEPLCSANSTLHKAFPLRLRSRWTRLPECGHEANPGANCCEDLLEVYALNESALARGEITFAHRE